jgi:hypothetical protein
MYPRKPFETSGSNPLERIGMSTRLPKSCAQHGNGQSPAVIEYANILQGLGGREKLVFAFRTARSGYYYRAFVYGHVFT